MKSLSEISVPEDLWYTKEHVWAKRVGTEVLIGVTDYAQDQLGEVSYVELPEVETHIQSGQGFGTVESIKAVNTLYTPLSGIVVAVNEELDNTPSLVNAGCYTHGWMIRILPDCADDMNGLLAAKKYHAFLEGDKEF